MNQPPKPPTKVPRSIITRDLKTISESTGNLYESLVVISKCSKQIAVRTTEELNMKLQDFAVPTDSLTEIFENQEQIEISKHYERMPKPTHIAIEEFLGDKLFFRRTQEDADEPSL